MKRILSIALISAAVVLMNSCSNFLSRTPYDSISTEDFWKSESDLELYAMGLIQSMIPSANTLALGDANTDLFAISLPTDILRPDATVGADNSSGWSASNWSSLRQINYMLDNMYKCEDAVSEEVYNHYEGVARFWRAWFYYGKVRTFSAVPWYEHVISSSDTEELYKGKDSREYVMDKVLEDLNFACENLSTDAKYVTGSTIINRWIALAFKSRVCLFEGTYRKYHSVEPSYQKPWDTSYNENDKFLREAADAAKQVIDGGVYSLYTGTWRDLFISNNLITTEVIFGRQFSNESPTAYHSISWYYNSSTYGSKYSFTKDFLDTFLMADGTPFTSVNGYARMPFYDDDTKTSEFDGRDARLAQTVAAPGYTRTISGTSTLFTPNWAYTRTGYQPIKHVLDDDSGNVYGSATSYNSLPCIRYAEVLLNYAEALCELGEFDTSTWNKTIGALRERVGTASIYPTEADPYMYEYFLETIDDPVLLEIRRERACELASESSLRWDDLMRWHMGDILSSANRPWRGIYVGDINYSYNITGGSDPDFYMTSSGSETSNSISIANTGNNESFSIGSDGNIVYEYTRVWQERNYLTAIPIDAITRNSNLEQNELWK